MKADIRYLANIDPVLASSTLLDRDMVLDLDRAYRRIYREGASIRLCPWAPERQCWLSLLGPKVTRLTGKKRILGNRPAVSTKELGQLPATPEKGENWGARSHIASWIKALPGGVESLSISGDKTAVDARAIDATLADNGQLTPTSRRFSATSSATLRLERPRVASSVTQTKIHRQSERSSMTQDSLLDRQDDRELVPSGSGQSSGIYWGMPALIPSLEGSEIAGIGPRTQEPSSSLDDESSESSEGSDSEAGLSANTGPSLRSSPRKTKISERQTASDSFANDLEEAMTRLLVTGPYRPGKLAMRAEFGRIVFGGMDPSGLAFNDEHSPSNGWRESELLKRLNANFAGHENILFTKILSTFGADIEDMINTQVNGTRIWKQHPSRTWIVYSFHCALRHRTDLNRFIVDIEDDGTGGDSFSYTIRPSNRLHSADGLMPVYIHAIRRHWDLRILLTHANTGEIEKVYGRFAETLLQSLSISYALVLAPILESDADMARRRNEKGATELRFTVPDSFAVDVYEVRTMTKWRHDSIDNKSALEIAEIAQMEIVPCSDGVYPFSGEGLEARVARPWTQQEAQRRRLAGESPRWYEAAVVSPDAEGFFLQNTFLELGERADWDAESLKVLGVFSAIHGPALQTLKEMDHVGRSDNNCLSQAYGKMLIRPNNPPRSVIGTSPTKGKQGQGQRRRRQRQGRSSAPGAHSSSDAASLGSGSLPAHR